MPEILVAGCGIKILGRERDLPILTDGARDDRTFSGGIRDKNTWEGAGFAHLTDGARDDRTFSGGMRDKNISEGAGFAHFDRHDA